MDSALQQRVVIRLWGDFRVLDGAGALIEITSKKARACLALLATAADATISRDRLAAMLWGDRTDTQARANLRQMLYELKPLMQASAPILGFDRHSAWFESACDLDTDALMRSDAAELAASLPGRGEIFLADLDGVSTEFDDWLAPERASAEATLRQTVQLRMEESLARRDFPAVRALADAWAVRDPTDEGIAQLGLRADAALGDGARIAQRMNRLQAALATELGVRPSAMTLALAREVSMQMPAIPAQVATPAPTEIRLPAAAASSHRARRWKFAAAAVAVAAGIAVASWRISEYRNAPSAAFVEAEHLTTNARELNRSRTRAGYAQATELARRAIARDPGFAPAWAELALASWLPAWWDEEKHAGAEAKAREDSLGYLDRALKLQPHLGRAMAIRGMILGDKAATPLLEQAVVEAPDDAEAWLWLGNQRAESGLMQEALEAYRRAAELEPLWERSVGAFALTAAQLGDHAEADHALDRFSAAAPNRFAAESLRASIARARGDLLSAARHGSLALSLAPDDPWIQMIELVLVARATGDVEAVRRITSAHADLRKRLAPLVDANGAVTRAEKTAPAVWWNSALLEDEARLLLRADRPDLLLAMVARQPLSLLELHRGRNSNGAPFGAQLILALRGSGRASEAQSLSDAIHADLDRLTASRHSYFDLDLANSAAFALEGRDDEAVAALGQAIAKGWRGQMPEWAVDPGDEPVFAHLRGREDFERVRSQLSAEIGRVRPQIAEILAQTAIPVLKTAVTDDP